MNRFLQLALLQTALWMFSAIAAAQEAEPPPVTPPATAPAPDRLAADWWSYFSVNPEGGAEKIPKRVETFLTKLDQTFEELDPDQHTQLDPLAARLKSGLDRYATLVTAEAPAVKPLSPPAERYTIDEAIERHNAWRQMDTEVRALRDDVKWQNSLLTQAFREQTQLRAAYLELKAIDPERFRKGLSLMAMRIELETRALEIAGQGRAADAAEAELEARAAELAEIPLKLSSDEAGREHWESRRAAADATLAEAQSQAEAEPQLAEISQSAAESSARARHAVLAAVNRELALASAELGAYHARIGLELSEVVSAAGETDWIEIGRQLQSLRDLTVQAKELTARARQTSERIRATAGDQLAAAEPNSGLAKVLDSTVKLAGETGDAQRTLENDLAATGFLADLLYTRQVASQSWWLRAWAEAEGGIHRAWGGVKSALGFTLFSINETPVTAFGLLWVIVILTIAWWVSKGVRRGLQRLGERKGGANKSSLYTLERIAHYVILFVGVLIGLSSLGLDFSKFTLFASALGVGLGFGLQNYVSNFVAGLIVLFEKSMNVGDFVELQSGVIGEVKEINMRSTLITTNDNIDVLIPNSEFVSSQVTNWTLREAVRRIHIPFGVAYGTDKNLVKKAVLEAATRVPWSYSGQKRREPQVWLVAFGESSLDFELVVWLSAAAVKRPGAVQADYLWEIETSLKDYGIEIPFPQRDLHLRGGFEALGARPASPKTDS